MTLAANPAGECSVCHEPYTKFTTTQVVCSVKCAKRVPVLERKKDRARREALKTRSDWMKDAQQAFNAWIRARDEHLGCISCDTRDGKVNAGHYLSTGARPELRFDPDNVHRQCERCNTHLHGNLIAYRARLIERRGLGTVERLEGPHAAKKYTVADLRAIRDEYRAKARALKA